MQCFINGQEISADCLARREMNLGQPLPEALPVTYRITERRDDFVNEIESDFRIAAAEQKADRDFRQEGQCPILDHWEKLAYPLPGQLVRENPQLLESLVREHLELEVLDHLLPGPPVGIPVFLINSIDRVEVNDRYVSIEGSAYLHPQLGVSPASYSSVSLESSK